MDGILAFELIGTSFCGFTDEPSWREKPPIQQNVQEGTYRQTGICCPIIERLKVQFC